VRRANLKTTRVTRADQKLTGLTRADEKISSVTTDMRIRGRKILGVTRNAKNTIAKKIDDVTIAGRLFGVQRVDGVMMAAEMRPEMRVRDMRAADAKMADMIATIGITGGMKDPDQRIADVKTAAMMVGTRRAAEAMLDKEEFKMAETMIVTGRRGETTIATGTKATDKKMVVDATVTAMSLAAMTIARAAATALADPRRRSMALEAEVGATIRR